MRLYQCELRVRASCGAGNIKLKCHTRIGGLVGKLQVNVVILKDIQMNMGYGKFPPDWRQIVCERCLLFVDVCGIYIEYASWSNQEYCVLNTLQIVIGTKRSERVRKLKCIGPDLKAQQSVNTIILH